MQFSIKRKVASFVLIGGGVLLLGTFLMYVLVDVLHWNVLVASAAQLAATLWANFQLNKAYTWTGCESPGMFRRFITTRLVTQVISFGLFALAVHIGVQYLLANIVIGLFIGVAANYVSSDKWVFKADSHADRAAKMMEHPEQFKLTWRPFALLSVLLVAVAAYLVIALGTLAVSLLLTALAVLSFGMAVFYLVTMTYANRENDSAERLLLPEPTGPSQLSIGVLMPARKGEKSDYARTLVHAAYSQRDHRDHRLLALLYDDGLLTIRYALAAQRVLHAWHEEGCVKGYVELMNKLDIELYELEFTAGDDAALSDVEIDCINEAIDNDGLLQILLYPTERLTAGAHLRRSKGLKLNHAWQMLWNRFDVFTILDAESMAAERLFTHVDQAFRDNPHVGIIQGPVQLMSPQFSGSRPSRLRQYLRRWYSWHNLLEYYRCFSGQMSLQADRNFVPLGGNTVFFTQETLHRTGGFPDTLTEDCAEGTRAAALGIVTMAFNDPKLATREETPPNVTSLVNQRTRWNQGFLQTLMDGEWRALPTMRQKALAVWILCSSFVQALSAILLPVTLLAMFTLKSPPGLVLVMYLPLATMAVGSVLQLKQLHEFGKAFDQHIAWHVYVLLFVTQPIYQWVLSYAAFKAVVRHLRNVTDWRTPDRGGDHIASFVQPAAAGN